ncbi:MAG TPA: hypothetical protein VFQ43_19935 [Nitrososphaera sp.]|nr:hypothetical protein [Nitrososphaera sp.]
MKEYPTNSLGFKLRFKGPSTADEYNQAAGRTDAIVEDAIDNTLYRGTLPQWQSEFQQRLEQMTGIKRGVDQEATQRAKSRSKKPDEVKDVPEKVKAYVARVTSQMSDADKAALNGVAQEVADGITIDPSPAKRQAGPDKTVLSRADSWLTLPDDQLQAKIDKALAAVDGFELETDEETGKPDRRSLAFLISRYADVLMG